MRFLKYAVLLQILLSCVLISAEVQSNLDAYISDTKKDIFEYEYKKNKEDSESLRDSWINPINLNYSYSKSNPYSHVQLSQNAAIKIDQPIFKGGGIFYGIEYANASKNYADYSIDMAKRKMIKDAISILMQIKQTDLKISRQNLQIQNSKINLELKKEQYLSGQLDSGFLDNAVIERNIVIQNLYDIETSREKLISKFHVLSDLDHKVAKVPHLELLSQEEFLKYNLSLELARSQALRDKENKGIIRAKYLPTVSITAGYNWTKNESAQFSANMNSFSEEKSYYDYGIKAHMPLSVNTFRDIESSKINYLKSEALALDKQKELKALFEQVMQNLENLDKKKALSLENINIYTKLLSDTRELYSAGYKTEYDVQTLENSVKMAEIDSQVFELDKQLELLNLYEMYANE